MKLTYTLRSTIVLLLVICFMAINTSSASEVFVEEGNIYYSQDGVDRTQLTSDGGARSPILSPDGRHLYFIRNDYETDAQVYKLDLLTGKEKKFVVGNYIDVVPKGSYIGHIVVSQLRHFIGGGSYRWYWLYTPDGNEVGTFGPELANPMFFPEEEGLEEMVLEMVRKAS